ncbi:probable mannose-1-phosphate guanylyltransferase 2 [Octopus sinensis]|uniref:Probable mannose-1-phosphate guanylyltransferase 2 n=1 Tax=Octopus sinensis TaxID=2607531 RepID=A0A7E6EH10_9MOLL|nr:probable mannose-1-phosphate guanylyltransferase 2 [Octopus sinensis]
MEGTVAVTTVKDPSKFGVLDLVETPIGTQIERFVEKPSVFVSDKINAGIYVLSPRVLNRIQVVIVRVLQDETHLNRERNLPQNGRGIPTLRVSHSWCCRTISLPGFWMDVGQPLDFLQATRLWLEHNQVSSTRPDVTIHQPVLIVIVHSYSRTTRLLLGRGQRLVQT